MLIIGAVIEYSSCCPDKKNLTDKNKNIGLLKNSKDKVEVNLGSDTEIMYSPKLQRDINAFNIIFRDGKLSIELLSPVDETHGPFGDYRIYVRRGAVFTTILVNVRLPY